MFKMKTIKDSKLADIIEAIAKEATLVPYGDGFLDLGWEELTVRELLDWLDEIDEGRKSHVKATERSGGSQGPT